MLQSKEDYMKSVKKITSKEVKKGHPILLGDNVFAQINLSDYEKGPKLFNHSVVGDTTDRLKQTLYRRAIRYRPSTLFLSIGSNDLAFGPYSVKEVFENIASIIEEVQLRCKKTKIYLITILPVHEALVSCEMSSMTDRIDNSEVSLLNQYLRQYARQKGIALIDAHKYLRNDFNQLCKQYTSDGFYLNEIGSKQLVSLLMQYV